MEKTHSFTESGLGQAPFKVVGYWAMPAQAIAESNPDFYRAEMREKPAAAKGSCDHCGRSITNHCIVISADGVTSAVGVECVKRTGDLGIIGRADMARLQANKDRLFRERELKIAKREEAEREKYNGLTEWEFDGECRSLYRAAILDVTEEIAVVLDGKKGGFCASIAADLRNGNLPTGKADAITEKIVAETKGIQWYRQRVAKVEVLRFAGPRDFGPKVLASQGEAS